MSRASGAAADRRDRTALDPVPAAVWRELIEGEVIVGRVVRLPGQNKEAGSRLFIEIDGETVAIPASAKKGHAVLERQLERLGVTVGKRIRITHRGWRHTQDGTRRYRHYTVEAA